MTFGAFCQCWIAEGSLTRWAAGTRMPPIEARHSRSWIRWPPVAAGAADLRSSGGRRSDPVRVSIYIDPSCPWTWITAAWLREVAPQRGLMLRWRSLSLVQHDGTELPPSMPEHIADPASGHLISQTVWRDPQAANCLIRAVEDYRLVFSSARKA
jgi:hypothetical protein